MSITRHGVRLIPIALCMAQGCDSSKPANTATASPSDAQRTAITQGSATPAQGAPGRPTYLDPRADGSYVDAQGNILTPPPVMLGVTMEQPGAALVKHMGINPARSTLLIDVIPGLPAAKAGLEDHDVVIAVDGSGDAGPHDIRRRLRAMKAGDTITFTVRRGPNSKTVNLKADAWKAEHMVRPIHAGTFQKPGLSQTSERQPTDPSLQPVMDRLDRIERQLQQLGAQSNTAQPPAASGSPQPSSNPR
jgi:hypothetical protein